MRFAPTGDLCARFRPIRLVAAGVGLGPFLFALVSTTVLTPAMGAPLCQMITGIAGDKCATILPATLEQDFPTSAVAAKSALAAKPKPAKKQPAAKIEAESKAKPQPVVAKKSSKSRLGDAPLEGDFVKAVAPPRLDTLRAVVERALDIHPQLGVARARSKEASAGVSAAKSALFPQLDSKIAGGQGFVGSAPGQMSLDQVGSKNAAGSSRSELGLTLRYKLLDFGATSAEIEGADAKLESSVLLVQDVMEDITSQVTIAYLRVLETRETLAISEENVVALRRLRELVESNEANGNSTKADVKRVQARLLDAESLLSDAQSDAGTASDRFERLVHSAPGPLKPAPVPTKQLPKTVEDAVSAVPQSNPKLLAGEASIRAVEQEAYAQFASTLPKISLESDVLTKGYRGRTTRDDLDVRTMISLSYKLVDGGTGSAVRRQILARLEQQQLQNRYLLDETTADLRQYYRSIAGARSKSASLLNGVDASSKARQLYDEQFAGGKRTLFELLDIQSAYYQARRSQIANRFDEHRASFNVLRSLGKLTETLTETGRSTLAERGKAASKASINNASPAVAEIVQCCGPIPR